MSLKPEMVAQLEERVKNWMKKVSDVVMESSQLRRENDSCGPQDELEYWKKRGAQFSQIVAHLQGREVSNSFMAAKKGSSSALFRFSILLVHWY